jgi:hypothetical protein
VVVERGCHPLFRCHTERPLDVRRRTSDLRARVNGDLQLEFADVALTSYAGLESFGQYLRATGFNATVRAAWAGTAGWGDFGAVAMVRLVIGLLIVGGRRLRHLAFVGISRTLGAGRAIRIGAMSLKRREFRRLSLSQH